MNGILSIYISSENLRKVGVKAVQEIASAKNHYRADECWVITNRFFTEQAKKLASSNEVRLIDRKHLMTWMLQQTKEDKGII
ncbi:restriction endonuclease [Robertmurraya siralis]|nr:restriction endonuclease [Robertmurraya siralis]